MTELYSSDCTLCGANTPKELRFAGNLDLRKLSPQNFSPRTLVNRSHFDFVECTKCGILFSDPVLPPQVLEKLYMQSDMEDEPILESRYEALEQYIYQSYAPILDRALEKTISKRCFVEVGGGSGFMLRYAVKMGFKHQVELELSQEALRKFKPPSANAKFLCHTLEESGLPPGSASLICFFQMLDHVFDPKAFLKSVLHTLEPGGAAVCVVHNTAALPNRLLRERSPILNVCHNYLFNPTNLAPLFEAVGFREIETFPISNRYPLWYWLYLLPLPQPLKRLLGGSLEALNLSGVPLSLSAGNFAVIAQKPFL